MSIKNVPPFTSHFDGGGVPSMLGVEGTLGTSDTGGTARTLPVGVKSSSGALYVHISGTDVDISGAAGGSMVNVVTGTQQTLGTVGVVNNLVKGTVTAVESGTLTALAVGTVGGKAASGAAAVANPVTIAGTDSGGTVYTPLVTSAGALTVTGASAGTVVEVEKGTLTTGSLSNVAMINAGSVNIKLSSGVVGGAAANALSSNAAGMVVLTAISGSVNPSLTDARHQTLHVDLSGNLRTIEQGTPATKIDTGTLTTGSLSNIAMLHAGTVVVPTGTLTTGSLTNLATLHNGTVVVPTGTITTGSLTNLAVLHAGTVVVSAINDDIDGGTIDLVSQANVTVGTFSADIPGGTIDLLSALTSVGAGTLNTLGTVGVLNNGTVSINPVPVPTTLTFGTLGTAGGSFFATVSAASGAGTKHYISGIDIVMQSGTADIRVLAGSVIQGTGVLAAGQFTPGGGISKRITPAFATGTNSEVLYHFVGAGTAFIVVSYWKGA